MSVTAGRLRLGFSALALAAMVAIGCGNPRSLLRVFVSGDRALASVTLSLQATGGDQTVVKAQYPSVMVPLQGTTPLGVGLYLPSSMHGAVVVRGAAVMGACEIAAGQVTSGDVASGMSVAVDLTLTSEDCVAVGDAGAGGTGGNPAVDAGSGGAGEGTGGAGGQGTGGNPAADAGTGGAPGTGGAMGTGGVVMGSGGATGSGGQPDAGVDIAEPDAPPDVVTPPDVPCEPDLVAHTCGQRCNIDVTNNCGQTVHCGGCAAAGDMCGGTGMPNVCVPCQDMGRACRNLQCGTVVDACGQRVSCGVCPLRETCCNGRCQLPIRCLVQ